MLQVWIDCWSISSKYHQLDKRLIQSPSEFCLKLPNRLFARENSGMMPGSDIFFHVGKIPEVRQSFSISLSIKKKKNATKSCYLLQMTSQSSAQPELFIQISKLQALAPGCVQHVAE